jgi:hypothetical protein
MDLAISGRKAIASGARAGMGRSPTPTITHQWGTGRIITGNIPHSEMTSDNGLWQTVKHELMCARPRFA